MEKILVVINAYKPQLSAIRFACLLAASTKSCLTGLFIENVYDSKFDESYSEGDYFTSVPQEDTETIVRTDPDHAITLFVRECSLHAVATETYVDKGEPIQLALRESRYADLLILDPSVNFYEDGAQQLPSHFTKEIMSGAECPVMLAPDKITDVDEIVFCYDGSASAVYAMKQFTYLLPVYQKTKVLLLTVKRSEKENASEDDRRILAWLTSHYDHADYKILTGNVKEELFTYFFMKEKKLVVLGSYGRNTMSTFFKPSAADQLVRTVDLPLFITHLNR